MEKNRMSNYIKREDVENMLENADLIFDREYAGYCTEDISIDEIPAADVVEVKHGKWIKPHWHNSIHCMNCSICGGEAQHVEFRGVAKYYSRCPHCGAKMDLEG